MKGSVTISRRGYEEAEKMVVSVVEKNSRLHLIEFEIDPSELMRALTSLAYRPIEIKEFIHKDDFFKVGMRKENKEVFIPKPKMYSTKEQKVYITEYLMEHPEYFQNGWELSDDGTRSQQNGEKWRLSFRRWVNE